MRGKIGLTGLGERIDRLVSLQRLERIALRMPSGIVDDDRDTAMRGDAPADFAGDGWQGRTGFHHVAGYRIG